LLFKFRGFIWERLTWSTVFRAQRDTLSRLTRAVATNQNRIMDVFVYRK